MNQIDPDDPEQGSAFQPKFDASGLLTAMVVDPEGQPLMLAHMNRDALDATLASGEATFWSRSRNRLWKKGESSGHVLKVREIRIDCDQDALWIIADPAGPACHTGAPGCFYRRLDSNGRLVRD